MTDINYKTSKPVKSSASSTQNETKPYRKGLWYIDICKENHFTVSISGFQRPDIMHKTYGEFLPVKSITYTPVTIETLNLSLGVISDLPIPYKRKVGKIELDILDTDDHWYENLFYEWYAATVPDNSGYVGYFEDFVREFRYVEYGRDGKAIKTYFLEVIPNNDYRVTRSYENNDFKVIHISLLVVGVISGVYSLQRLISNEKDTTEDTSNVSVAQQEAGSLGSLDVVEMPAFDNTVSSKVANQALDTLASGVVSGESIDYDQLLREAEQALFEE